MPDWLIPVLSIVGAVIGGWLGMHSRVVRTETKVERIESEIGTHESGLRGAVHRTANRVTEIDMRLHAIERKIKE